MNSGVTCYAGSTVQGLVAVQLDQHLNGQAFRTPAEMALVGVLGQMCVARRDPRNGPVNPVPLIAAVNACFAQPMFGNNGQGECAGDFLTSLLSHLDLQPGYLVHNLEDGVCQVCGGQFAQLYGPAPNMILLAPPAPHQGGAPVDLALLLAATRAALPSPTLVCQGQGPCAGQAIPSILIGTQDKVLLVHLVRNLLVARGAGNKILTPVLIPPAHDPQWPGLRLKVVLAHSAVADHWIAYVNVLGVWWRADTLQPAPVQEDPF